MSIWLRGILMSTVITATHTKGDVMTKIDSNFIKSSVVCSACESTKLKRTYKKSYKSPINTLGYSEDVSYEWRQFTCSECGHIINVVNDGDSILAVGSDAKLPLSAFTASVFKESFDLCVVFNYRENNGILDEDCICGDNILNLQPFLNLHGVFAEEVMENTFAVYFDESKFSFITEQDAIYEIIELLVYAGCKILPADNMGNDDNMLNVLVTADEFNEMVYEYNLALEEQDEVIF